ncbi:ATP-binding protein [Streptomyces sp. NPDC006458]|uniref:ATP-binding protein n=1 Tax=Streptomyces sp. NPDC006458 TaxID=3154302 RepID=UPI0033A0CF7D
MFQRMNTFPVSGPETGISSLAPPPTLRSSLHLPAVAASVPQARRFTRSVLGNWGFRGEVLDDAEIIVSELAGNAALHGRSDLTVRLALGRLSPLHVTVIDSGDRVCRRTPDLADDEHGRGLLLVQGLARHVLVTRQPSWHRVRVCVTTMDGPPECRTCGLPGPRTGGP